VRYFDVGGTLHAVDINGHAHFAALGAGRCRVESVELVGPVPGGVEPLRFHQDDDALHLDLPRLITDRRGRRVDDVRVYRIVCSDIDRPDMLFLPEPRDPIALAPLMRDVSPGDIVQLGDGVYTGPVTVPRGVVIRGLGGHRTVIDGGGTTAVTLEGAARLEHLTVTGGPARTAWLPTATVEITGPAATVLGCRIDGHVVVRASDALIRATTAAGVVADGVDRLSLSRCHLSGMRWDVGVHLIGGGGHEIDSSELNDHLCAIRVSDATAVVVRGNNITARWWGIHLERTEGAHVHGNFVNHTMRGIDIDGGSQALVDGNAVCDGDSGCIVQWGASDCDVSGNRWERCRIGVLQWDAIGLRLHANEAIDLHDTPLVTGP
jgi:alpha-L-fucosidase